MTRHKDTHEITTGNRNLVDVFIIFVLLLTFLAQNLVLTPSTETPADQIQASFKYIGDYSQEAKAMIAAYAEVPGPIHLGRRMKFNAKLVGPTGTLYNPVDPFGLELKFMRPPRCNGPAISAEAATRARSLSP